MRSIYSNSFTLFCCIVVNLTRYFHNYPAGTFGPQIEKVLQKSINRDGSYAMLYYKNGHRAMDCMVARFGVGVMQTDSSGCIVSTIIMNLMFSVIITMIVIRYLMAILFQWIISRRLVKPGGRSNWLAWRSVQGGNADPGNHIRSPDNSTYTARYQSKSGTATLKTANMPSPPSAVYQVPRYPTPRSSSAFNTSTASLSRPSSMPAPPPIVAAPHRDSLADITPRQSDGNLATYRMNTRLHSSTTLTSTPSSSSLNTPPFVSPQSTSEIVQTELYTCMMVTCYSEGEDGIRTTMDSLAETTYSNKHKVVNK